ncbi:MAG: hypothetical protein CVV21_04420 [Candidatus Goldiibacteriota bacterium HGW-Goldbacteria-1]|nr:MAG: hypothetical protein CVV21_04420 [Candidatus Goldiibacteriota bacterium HGW-Goldbacteria-1]
MKMHVWSLFWGVFFILIGISIMLKAFGIILPLFRILFAAFVIFVGISILFPGVFKKCCGISQTGRETMFSESTIEGNNISGEYSTIFGASNIDLTKVEPGGARIELNAVFGGVKVKIDKAKPYKIKGNAAFGGVMLPNGNTAAFGTTIYVTDSYKEGSPAIEVEANAVFGGIEIR